MLAAGAVAGSASWTMAMKSFRVGAGVANGRNGVAFTLIVRRL